MEVSPAQSMHFKISLSGSDKDSCSTLTLSPNLFVDLDEITKLDNAGKLGRRFKFIQGNADVELPEVALDSVNTVLQLQLQGDDVVVPIHARYPLLQQRARSITEAGLAEGIVQTSLYSCDKTQSTQHTTQHTKTVYIPTGVSDHQDVVGRVNVAVTMIAFLYILYTLYKQLLNTKRR